MVPLSVRKTANPRGPRSITVPVRTVPTLRLAMAAGISAAEAVVGGAAAAVMEVIGATPGGDTAIGFGLISLT